MKKLLLLIAISVLAMTLIAVANADVPSLTVAPANSHMIRVTGVGFNASETVKLSLMNATEYAYNFTEAITTDGEKGDLGNFTAIVIAPTSLNGSYNLTASTSTVTWKIQITLPDLTGPQGEQGTQGMVGSKGETGPQGIQGEQGIQGPVDTVAVVIAGVALVVCLVISLVAIVIVVVKSKY